MEKKFQKWILEDERGKRPGQKFKSLLVMQYILKNADDENAVTMDEILNHLAKYGIEAERRSVYRDIHDLVELMNAEQEEGSRIKERDKLNYEITFTRKPHKDAPNGGYLVTARPYKFTDLRLLAECVNSARFLSENQARNLRRTISGLCSKEQAKLLNTDSTVVNRSKTANTSVMDSIQTINQAIRHGRQIRFKYLSYSFDNMRTQVERRSGKFYVVNPYKMLIDNGFFYLLTYNGTKTIVYRIDRMKDVKELLTAREWEKEFKENVDMDNYTKRVFSMFGGNRMIAVSDSGRCAGKEEGYQFDLGGQMAEIRGGVAKLVGTETIACSASNLWTCLCNAISWGIPEAEAVRAATYNPACALGVQDVVGSIETGKVADFLVCADGYESKRVFLAGKEL